MKPVTKAAAMRNHVCPNTLMSVRSSSTPVVRSLTSYPRNTSGSYSARPASEREEPYDCQSESSQRIQGHLLARMPGPREFAVMRHPGKGCGILATAYYNHAAFQHGV